MPYRESYTKHERAILPTFRARMSAAESTEDVKKFFAYSADDLLSRVCGETCRRRADDVVLAPTAAPYFAVNDRLSDQEAFAEIWGHSDLRHLLTRLAELAAHRFVHLSKHRDKTESKLYPPKGPRRY